MRNADVLLLTTKGWKTGKERTRPLLYMRDSNRLIIIASNGGRRADPSWWMNLQHDPVGTVQIKGEKATVYAQRASGSEQDRLWAQVTKMYPGYLAYQKKTSRQIPVVILKPKTV